MNNHNDLSKLCDRMTDMLESGELRLAPAMRYTLDENGETVATAKGVFINGVALVPANKLAPAVKEESNER